MSLTPIARNAPCPCGSGKRFKNCHGDIGSADEPADSTDARAAIEASWRALEVDPENAAASLHLGNFNLENGEYEAARIHYERALRGDPGNAIALNNLGLCYKALADNDEAEHAYRAALAADPARPDALANLVNLLFQRERYAEVVRTTERLPASAPASAFLLRAVAQEHLGDVASSEGTLRQGVRSLPADATLHAFLGALYLRTGRYEEAEPVLADAIRLAPQSAGALSMLAEARENLCAWADLREIFARLEALVAKEDFDDALPVDPVAALAMPLSIASQLNIARRRATAWSRPNAERPVVELAPGERLRVGFVSAAFGDRDAPFLWPALREDIDRSRLETYAYALGSPHGDPSERRAGGFEHLVDVGGESTPRIVQRIRNDRIAILIDLDGYARRSHASLFALRPAPIQINGAFPGTMGADGYDYILTDRFGIPESLQRFYSERPLYLPHAAVARDDASSPSEPPLRRDYALPEHGFVFACFNDTRTILPDVFAAWMRLLAAVRESVLWVLECSAAATANLRREVTAAGVDPQRLVFARADRGTLSARSAAADLFLDTYPYSGRAAAGGALRAGVPVVTCSGETLASRLVGSQLLAVDLPELVTTGLEDYERLALRLATEPTLLASYRQRLAAGRQTAPLFDVAGYGREFEATMHRLWTSYAATPS